MNLIHRFKDWIPNSPIGLILLLTLVIVGLNPMMARAEENGQRAACDRPFEFVSPPLTELAGRTYHRMDGTETGFEGGLFPNGSNTPPPSHLSAGEAVAAGIQPLDGTGKMDLEAGRIVMVSIGMSNTAQEFAVFERMAREHQAINPKLMTINGAVGGRTAENWVDPNNDAWDELSRRLEHASITPEQVQVAWIKLTLVRGGDFPGKAISLQEHLTRIVQELKDRFPNLQIAFLSSRTRSYTYWRGLSPEPAAFETGFAVKWLIEDQIEGKPELNFNPTNGTVEAPYLTWGPYLWANGQIPREDGFVWLPEDLTGDCTHPSESGKQKVARLMLDFFLTNPVSQVWFTDSGQISGIESGVLPSPTAQPTELTEPPVELQATPSPTQEESPTMSPTKTIPAPPDSNSSIAGGILAGLSISGLFVLAAILLMRRRAQN